MHQVQEGEKRVILYKSLPADKAPNGYKFRLNEWNKISGKLEICHNGFHASENIIHTMGYVAAGWVARVEVRGESEIQDDKQCWSEMRIIEWHKWTKKDSVALAIFAAELCIKEFEKVSPKDDRPRKAIEAAKAVLKNDTAKNRSAARSAAWSAWSAESAWSAWSARSAAEPAAESAARSAAWSAWSAAEPAWSAARSAAWSAWSAARSAARSAAIEKIYQKCHNFVIERKFTRLFIKRCPKCDGKLDYDHIGYKGDRGYCHNCKWQDAKSICEEEEV